jgi:hypothetical protein
MSLLRTFVLLSVFIISNGALYAQKDSISNREIVINNFVVKENLLKNNKIAIIATDENEKPLESVNGTFMFSFNGFQQELKFNDGVAIGPQPIDKSAFLYLRHENGSGTHGKLYYIYKKDDNLRPFKINWAILVLVPLGIIVLATLFRKFIIIGGILIIIMFFFNSQNGLKLPTFFDTVFDGLKNLF